MSLFRPRTSEQRAITNFVTDADWGTSSISSAGVNVTPDSSLRLITVWACVRLIAGSIASLPTSAYVRNGLVRESYPNPRWMYNPNPEQTAIVFWEQVLMSLLLYGNAYIALVRDNRYDVQELWVLHPSNVTPRRDGLNNKLQYHCHLDDGTEKILQPDSELMHIKGLSAPGSLTGLNPIQQAREAIGLGLATEEFGARFFAQGTSTNVVLESDQELSEEQLRRTAESWKRSHTGLRKAHLPAVLTGLTAKNLTIPNDQAQFLETRKFQRSEIASLFAVPPHMIGDVTTSTSWGTGIEQQQIGFVVHTLRTWIERVEQSCNILFPPESRAFMKFNVDGLLRGDTAGRYNAYAVGLNNGFLSPDEVRALEDRAPIPGGKGSDFRQPMNMGPLGTQPAPTKQGTTA